MEEIYDETFSILYDYGENLKSRREKLPITLITTFLFTDTSLSLRMELGGEVGYKFIYLHQHGIKKIKQHVLDKE
ncbi:CLUMA_CG002063, isoform A [Clunio marinus]|uniref:CLUMA_CG002063, isoform A n=1 Tax=Clunio marinus TaxID=568069 RepID=A0A1J1HLJ7_9DIPT|nr:CLUMA_CG002063, isoform A [Clunio marinus]